MNRKLTEEELTETWAEGMEAAHCGLFMKDGPRAHNGRRAGAWRAGYRQALIDLALQADAHGGGDE
jgi:hypothetical protein